MRHQNLQSLTQQLLVFYNTFPKCANGPHKSPTPVKKQEYKCKPLLCENDTINSVTP